MMLAGNDPMKRNIPPQLRHLNTSTVLGNFAAVLPLGVTKLRRRHDHLSHSPSRACTKRTDENMDSSTQAKHETCEFAI